MTKQRSGKLALGAAIAAGFGYLLGILTAPKSGKETRKDISKAAVKARAESERRLKDLHGELSKLIARGKTQAESLGSRAKEELDQALNAAQSAKEKARSILSAMHEGEAEDKDLDKAINDVKTAVTHLKQYLKSDAGKAKK